MDRTWSVNEGLRRFSSTVFHPIGWFLARVLTPNLITTLSVLAAAATGYCFATGRFVVGPWLLFLSGLFDIWDGQVAKMTGRVSTFGSFYDSTADRISDFFFGFGALYFFTVEGIYDIAIMVGAYLALSSLISYVKARAEGLGLACNVGLLARPLRMLFFGISLFIYGLSDNIWVFRGPLYVVLALGVETLIHRFAVVYFEARRKDESAAAE